MQTIPTNFGYKVFEMNYWVWPLGRYNCHELRMLITVIRHSLTFARLEKIPTSDGFITGLHICTLVHSPDIAHLQKTDQNPTPWSPSKGEQLCSNWAWLLNDRFSSTIEWLIKCLLSRVKKWRVPTKGADQICTQFFHINIFTNCGGNLFIYQLLHRFIQLVNWIDASCILRCGQSVPLWNLSSRNRVTPVSIQDGV